MRKKIVLEIFSHRNEMEKNCPRTGHNTTTTERSTNTDIAAEIECERLH